MNNKIQKITLFNQFLGITTTLEIIWEMMMAGAVDSKRSIVCVECLVWRELSRVKEDVDVYSDFGYIRCYPWLRVDNYFVCA